LLVLPAIFLFLPADFFDHGTTICPSKLLLDMHCPGCGMSRATQHLIHFDFNQAWRYNKLTFFVLPVLGYFYLKELKGQFKIAFK
jgi:hypothetical protein